MALEVAALFGLRLYFQPKRSPGDDEKEAGLYVVVMSLVALVQVVSLVGCVAAPQYLDFAHAPLPYGLRFVGALVAAVALAGLGWIHSTLGTNYNAVLHVRADHELVTGGPYQRVRHPMYTALLAVMLGLSLLSANALVAASCIGGLAIIVARRLPREEALMLERFGPAYRDYMTRTNRFFP